jgi:thioredoxin 1
MRRLLPALLLLAGLSLAACSRAESATPAAPAASPGVMAAHGTPPAAARPRLVFFMNPNGRPCQLQDEILRSMGPALTGAADVVYYRTTEASEIQMFQAYGVRSLPLLVVTDGAGRELRRATPGIQSAEAVRQLVTFQGS